MTGTWPWLLLLAAADQSLSVHGSAARRRPLGALQRWWSSFSETDASVRAPVPAPPDTTACKLFDVKMDTYPMGIPYLFSKDGKFEQICGHFQWDNDYGANNACKKMGYDSGKAHEVPNKKADADMIYVGACRANEFPGTCSEGPFEGRTWWGDRVPVEHSVGQTICAKGKEGV